MVTLCAVSCLTVIRPSGAGGDAVGVALGAAETDGVGDAVVTVTATGLAVIGLPVLTPVPQAAVTVAVAAARPTPRTIRVRGDIASLLEVTFDGDCRELCPTPVETPPRRPKVAALRENLERSSRVGLVASLARI